MDADELARKERREDAIRAHDAWTPVTVAHFNVVLSSGAGALRLVAAINGAALVALLGFTAGIVGKGGAVLSNTNLIAAPMIYFAVGLALAVAAAGGVYFAQTCYAKGTSSKNITGSAPMSGTRRKQ